MLAYDTLDAAEAAYTKWRGATKTKPSGGFSCLITNAVAIEFMVKHYGAKGDSNIDNVPYQLMHPSGDHSDEDFDEEDFDDTKTAEENLAEYNAAKDDAEDFHLLFTNTQQGDLCEDIDIPRAQYTEHMTNHVATAQQIKEYVEERELWQIWSR